MAENAGSVIVEVEASLSKLKKGLDQVEKDTKETAKKSEEAFKKTNISFDTKFAKMSLQEVEKLAEKLKATLEKRIAMNAPVGQLNNLQSALGKAESALARYTREEKQAVQSSGQLNAAMGQLGYTIGDAGMFMVNFRMGMMSVANNIPMIVTGLMNAKAAAEATGTSFKSQLASSLLGPGGVMIGINALMLALNILPQLLSDADNASSAWDLKSLAGETGDFAEAMKDLREEIKGLSSSELDTYFDKLNSKLTDTVNKAAEFGDKMAGFAVLNTIAGFNLSGLIFSEKANSEESVKRITALVSAIKDIQNQKSAPGILGGINNEIEEINKKLLDAKTPQEINKLNASLKALETQKNKLLGKEDKKKGNWLSDILGEESELSTRLNKVQKALGNQNLTYFQRVNLIQEAVRLQKELSQYEIKPGAKGLEGLPGGLLEYSTSGKMPLASGASKQALSEVTGSMKLQLTLANSLEDAFNGAGNALSQTLGNAVFVFKEANSVAQQFINSLVQIGLQSLAISAIGSLSGGGILGALGGLLMPSASVSSGTSGLKAGIDSVNNSIQALNMNVIKKDYKPNIVIVMDGKEVTKGVSSISRSMAKNGVNLNDY